MGDMIYRQDAIDALGERPMVWTDSDYEIAQRNQYDRDKLAIETVPAAQPEPCEDAVSRQAAIDVLKMDTTIIPYKKARQYVDLTIEEISERLKKLPSAQPEQRWIPVTLETLPNPSSVVVVCGKKGTWDYGTYRGWHGDIHSWWWKKNTIKHVYWWMYKDDALPEPYREEGGE